MCPAGTLVSAACADRSAFAENPCACTALRQLAALSQSLRYTAPWNNLANRAYCQTGSMDASSTGSLRVYCATVDGVELPTAVNGFDVGLTGALPPSLGELGSSLTYLDLGSNAITSLPAEIGALTALTFLSLGSNAITSVPSELGALTGLRFLELSNNQLTGVPAEFRNVDPSEVCYLNFNELSFSCANVGAGTFCCDEYNCPYYAGGTSTCYSG